MSGQRGRPYKPEMIDKLSRYPDGQKGGPIPVKNLGISQDDWEAHSTIEAGSEATAEKKRKQRAAVQCVRDAYFNRSKNGHVFCPSRNRNLPS